MTIDMITATIPYLLPGAICTQLNCVRYSDIGGWEGLEKLISELWKIKTDLTPDPEIVAMGIQPLRDPSCVPNATAGNDGSTRWVLFDAGPGIKAFYVLGSATKDNSVDGSTNVFTDMICELLATYKPERIVVPKFDRLVRTLPNAGRIWKAGTENAETIVSADSAISFAEPFGEMTFCIQVMGSTATVKTINKSLVNGRINSFQAGQCPIPIQQLPLGYIKDDHGVVGFDLSQRPAVEAIVSGLASGATPDQIATAASSVGGTTYLLRRIHGAEATFLDASNPAAFMEKWIESLEIWKTGKMTYTFRCPEPGVSEYQGMVVEGAQRNVRGTILIPVDLGLPPDGWAEPNLLAAAIERTRPNKKPPTTGGATHSTRLPLAGFSWKDSDHEWRLFGDTTRYRIRRRSHDAAATRPRGGWGRPPHLDGETISRVVALDLHRSIADAIANAVSTGVKGQHIPGFRTLSLSSHEHRDDTLMTLQRTFQEQQTKKSNLLEAVATASSTEVIHSLVEQAERVQATIDELAVEVGDNTPHGDLEADVDAILRALTTLAAAEHGLDRSVNQALATLLEDFSIDATGTWKVTVLLPTTTGCLRLAPITGTVQPRAKWQRSKKSINERGPQITTRFMSGVSSVSEMAHRDGIKTAPIYVREINANLATLGLHICARSLLIADRTPPSTRHILWDHLNQTSTVDHDPAWKQHIIALYTNPQLRSAGVYVRSTLRRQAIIDEVTARGGTVDYDTLIASTWITPADIATSSSARKHHPTLRCDGSTVQLLRCPHCGEHATKVLILPEITTNVLCANCRHLPTPNSPLLPEDYLTQEW